MRRTKRALLFATTLICAACTGRPAEDETKGPGRPNVFLISIDTLRADRLPAYGYDGVETPAIDGLRRDAILFEHAYTSVPLTLPAHTSLLTGLTPPTHGVRDNLGYRLDGERHPSLAEWLREAGYATGAAVSTYVLRGTTGLDTGFDWYDDQIEVTAQAIGELQRPGLDTAKRAIEWLDRNSGRPVFLLLHLFEPHTPYTPPEPFASRYEDPYDGEIATADSIVGHFLEALRARGLYEEAVVLLFGDHGEGLGDHGEAEHGVLLHRETIGVPLLLKLPGGERAGETVPRPVQLLDVPPTVLALVAGMKEQELPGRNLLAADDGGRLLYSESYHARLHFGWSELRSLVDGQIHFIDGPSPELYDLASDPGETQNVLLERRADARRLRAELEAIEPAFLPPAQSDPEEMARLRSLGYLSAPATAKGPLLDPKSQLPVLRRVREGLRTAAAGNHEAAVEILGAVLDGQPGMLDVRFQLAQSLTALGRLDEALAHYRKAIDDGSIALPALLIESGRILLTLGDLDEAESHADAALEALPVEAHQLRAQIATRREDADRALAEARAAVAAEGLPRAESLLLLGRILLSRGEYQEALDTLDRIRSRVESGSLAPVRGLEAERGEALGRLNRLGEAEQALLHEIETFPDHALAYRRLCFVYGAQHRFDRIEPTLEAMVAANPTRATYLLAADTVRRLGDAEGARAWEARAGR